MPDEHVLITGTTRVSDNLNHSRSPGLIYLQIRVEWVPDSLTCGLPNTQSAKLAIASMLVSDITLLLIMLVGLLRLRHGGEGRFNLGRLLWKQVRWSRVE